MVHIYLGGHSFGAMIAYEMAMQLLAQGHEVGLLAIIDQQRPGWRLAPAAIIPALYRILAAMPARVRYELMRVPSSDRYRELQRLLLRWSKAALGYKLDAVSMFKIDRSETELIARFEAGLQALATIGQRLTGPDYAIPSGYPADAPFHHGSDAGLERRRSRRGASAHHTGRSSNHDHGTAGSTSCKALSDELDRVQRS